MNNADDYLSYIRHAEREHRHLHQSVQSVRRVLRVEADTVPAELSEHLDALRAELVRHFAEEESGGCLEEAICRMPRLAAEAERIRSEHALLLRRLDEIVTRLRRSSPARAGLARCAADFTDFARQLSRHEAAETRLLEAGFNVNLELRHQEAP